MQYKDGFVEDNLKVQRRRMQHIHISKADEKLTLLLPLLELVHLSPTHEAHTWWYVVDLGAHTCFDDVL